MNQLSIIQHPAFGQLRTELIDNEPLFCAIDVCRALGYKNHNDAIKNHCREKGVANRYTLSNGGTQNTLFINEGNLYRLILRSKLPAAEKFESWVCDEVLPSLRKTGRYHVEPRYGQTLLTRGELQNETLNFSSAVLPEIAKIEQGPLRNRLAGLVSYYINKIS